MDGLTLLRRNRRFKRVARYSKGEPNNAGRNIKVVQGHSRSPWGTFDVDVWFRTALSHLKGLPRTRVLKSYRNGSSYPAGRCLVRGTDINTN